MRSKISKVFQIASVYVGTILGAGFASGQEMMQFFSSYGIDGIYGIILAGLLFSIIGWAVLEIVYIYQLKNYQEFLYPIMGKTLGTLMEWTVAIFLGIIFCAMLAGSGALLEQKFHLPYTAGILFMALTCFITFLFDIKGVIAINCILAPLLFIGGLLIGIYTLVFREASAFSFVLEGMQKITRSWVVSAIVYVSYNTITAVVVLTSLRSVMDSKKSAKWGGILGGIALGILGLSLVMATMINYGKVQGLEIPMLEIVMQYGKSMQYIYLFVLFAAMFTTAVANGYGFISRMSDVLHIPFYMFTILFILVSIVVAHIGFSNMVGKLYPIFGYIGLFEIILILLYFINSKLKRKNTRSNTFEKRLQKMR